MLRLNAIESMYLNIVIYPYIIQNFPEERIATINYLFNHYFNSVQTFHNCIKLSSKGNGMTAEDQYEWPVLTSCTSKCNRYDSVSGHSNVVEWLTREQPRVFIYFNFFYLMY